MGTKREGDVCYEKAGIDEPIFVLRAQDKTAPGFVRAWANFAEALGCTPSKVAEARALADRMEEWAEENGGKAPD